MARRSFTQTVKDWFTRTQAAAADFIRKRWGKPPRPQYNRAQWQSVLDTKTCPTCGARHGRVYAADERFPFPPAHPRCRCLIVFLKTNEPVPKVRNFDEWLLDQPESTVENILGKAKAKLFLEGGLEMTDFVDSTDKPYTLKDLKRRDRELYEEILES